MEFCVKLLSFPSWERGLKYKGSLLWGGGTIVVPLVGAWIEILLIGQDNGRIWSFPSWERGLKYSTVIKKISAAGVVPLVGAWIEIKIDYLLGRGEKVVPLVGAWIEISGARIYFGSMQRRSPRGSVD